MNGQLVWVSGDARKPGCNSRRSVEFQDRSIAEANAQLKQGFSPIFPILQALMTDQWTCSRLSVNWDSLCSLSASNFRAMNDLRFV